MIEQLKELEQEAMDNVDSNEYVAITSNVMEEDDIDIDTSTGNIPMWLYRWFTNRYKTTK